MIETKSAPNSSEELDWSKIMKADEQFCSEVLESDRSIIKKIQLLRSNPCSSNDIVAEMLEFAPYVIFNKRERQRFLHASRTGDYS